MSKLLYYGYKFVTLHQTPPVSGYMSVPALSYGGYNLGVKYWPAWNEYIEVAIDKLSFTPPQVNWTIYPSTAAGPWTISPGSKYVNDDFVIPSGYGNGSNGGGNNNGGNGGGGGVTPSPVAPANLWEYYTQKGLELPSIHDRSFIYERFGLGAASGYSGTEAQNIKLLAAILGAEKSGTHVVSFDTAYTDAPEAVQWQASGGSIPYLFESPAYTHDEQTDTYVLKEAWQKAKDNGEDLKGLFESGEYRPYMSELAHSAVDVAADGAVNAMFESISAGGGASIYKGFIDTFAYVAEIGEKIKDFWTDRLELITKGLDSFEEVNDATPYLDDSNSKRFQGDMVQVAAERNQVDVPGFFGFLNSIKRFITGATHSDVYYTIQNSAINSTYMVGDGHRGSILGSIDSDILIGNSLSDVVMGQYGNDQIDGKGGDDKLWGHFGHDQVLGGEGNDFVSGGPGNDVVDGGVGEDCAVFEGELSQHHIAYRSIDDVVFVIDTMLNRGGYDSVSNVENFKFGEIEYSASEIRSKATVDNDSPAVMTFAPSKASSDADISSDIVITFSEDILGGTGEIILQHEDGTKVHTFNVMDETDSRIKVSGKTLTINPESDLSFSTKYSIVVPAGAIIDFAGNGYVGTNLYSFTTAGDPVNQTIVGNLLNEFFTGGTGNDAIDGSGGIDVSSYSFSRLAYTVLKTATGFSVKALVGSEGADSLSNVERLQFSSSKLALDIDGNAGIVAKILASVFGASAVTNKQYAGIGLSYVDGGMTYEALSALAISAAGAKTREAVVDLLWTNLMDKAPTAAEAKPYIDMLATDLSNVGSLGKLAGDYAATIGVVNLTALSQTGLEYI